MESRLSSANNLVSDDMLQDFTDNGRWRDWPEVGW